MTPRPTRGEINTRLAAGLLLCMAAAAVGWLLESEILAAQKKPAEASESMREALARQPNGMLAARTYVLLITAGKAADAAAFAARWEKDHPQDAAFHNLLGQYRQSRGDVDGAVASYRAALAIEHQAELHSNDADFARFPGLRWKNPLR